MQPAYEHFSATDFLTDDAFVNHQLAPTPESSAFWNDWLAQHAGQHTAWQEAIDLLEAIRLGLDDYAQTHLSEETIRQLLVRIQRTNAQPQPVVRSLRWGRWAVAASVLLLLGLGLWWQLNRWESPYERQLAALQTTFTEKTNTTDQPNPIQLPDGSVVTLSPNSRLSFAADFGRRNRTVYLSGEATFDVTKDVRKPFLVHANEVVTKVLGTTFVVRAFVGEKAVKVNVQSGQVSVYRDGAQSTDTGSGANQKGVLLLPNQQAVFSRQSEQFNKTLVDAPRLLTTTESPEVRFSYDEAPIPRVFRDLQDAYGIDIRFNQEALAHCELSASLTTESFTEKLAIICKTVGATYDIIDGQVVVSGGNCQ